MLYFTACVSPERLQCHSCSCVQANVVAIPLTRMRVFVRRSAAHAAPRNQFKAYYREAKFDKCKQQFADLQFCAKLKTSDKATALVSCLSAAPVPLALASPASGARAKGGELYGVCSPVRAHSGSGSRRTC